MTNLNINNKKFPLFYLDNRGTVINRIAYNLKTLPEFLCFPFGEWNLETKSNIVVKNLIDLIRSEKQISFENFWNKIKTTCSWNDPLKDVLIPYLIFNPQLNDQDFAFYSLVIIDELGNLKSAKGEILAQVQPLKGEYIPLVMKGNEVAGIFNPKKDAEGELTSRMFHFIDDNLEGNQLVLVLAMTYYIFLRSIFVG